jgi:hypothetical protein
MTKPNSKIMTFHSLYEFNEFEARNFLIQLGFDHIKDGLYAEGGGTLL